MRSGVRDSPMHVLLLVRSLERGGGERQVVELARGLGRSGVRTTVMVMYAGGALERELDEEPEVTLVSLEKRGRWDVVGFLARFVSAVRRLNADVVYGFMPVANELALVAGRVGKARVVWGLRSSFMDFAQYDWLHGTMFRLGRVLSSRPELIIANSEAGRAHHVAAGYDGQHMVVIPNGIDTARWRPAPGARVMMRQRWGAGKGEVVAGLVGRVDAMKDHATFLAAIRACRVPGLRAVCIGGGDPGAVEALRGTVEQQGLAGIVTVTGPVDDMPAAYNGLDLLVSSSLGEGFSNVIAEAMSCGVPCVVTDVGDSAVIVGSFGEVVPPRQPDAMARAIERLVSRLGAPLSLACRARIVNDFGLDRMVQRTREHMEALE